MGVGEPGGSAESMPSAASPARVRLNFIVPTMALMVPVRRPSFSARSGTGSPSVPNEGSAAWPMSLPSFVSTTSTRSTTRSPVVAPIHTPSKAEPSARAGPAATHNSAAHIAAQDARKERVA